MEQMIQRRRRQRGSVLLLAVGLLAILAMLGTTLLLSSYLDARQSRALAAKAQADPIATGILAQVKATLKADLYLGANGPYEGLSADAHGWRRFIDYPSEDADPNFDGADVHLASPWTSEIRDGTAPWPHVSNLFNDTTTVTDVAFDDDALTDTDGDIDGVLGDPLKDARWYDTGVTNAEGQRYYAAVRVTDLSGKICLNTAAESNSLTTPTSPVNIELDSFLSTLPGTPYIDLHDARCGGATPQDFFDNSASTLFAPALPGYRPFAIGEEMYFRWLGQGQLTEAGRLAPIFNAAGLPVSTARQLTTFNCSRAIVRNPAGVLTEQIFIDPTVLCDPGSPSGRYEVYQRVSRAFERLGIGTTFPQRKEMAAHLVANLWAYQDYDRTRSYRFRPLDARFTVFGLVQDLVITEAFARREPASLPGATDWAWGCAIELMNPTDRGIDLSDYFLVQVDQGIPSDPMALSGSIFRFTRRVIYYFDPGDGTHNETSLFGVPSVAGWNDVADSDFSFNGPGVQTLKLMRRISATEEVPVDDVSDSDFGWTYSGSLQSATGSSAPQHGRRDDSFLRARYNVAAYKQFPPELGPHNLGSANDLSDSDLASEAVFSVPIIRKATQTRDEPITDVGELGLIYLTGPIDLDRTSTSYANLRGFPKRLVEQEGVLPDGPARGRLDFRGEYNSGADQYEVPVGGWAGGAYPDVPAAAMLGEFFTVLPPDTTRADDETRIYGRVNINTATREVLERLPWPRFLGEGLPGQGPAATASDIVDYILAYRDQTDVPGPGPHDYRDRDTDPAAIRRPRSDDRASAVANLRTDPDSRIAGFLTPGEIAIPLADYANWQMGWLNYSVTTASQELGITQDQHYVRNRDSLYRAISNLITVNSDVYSVNIRVDLYDVNESPGNDPPDEPAQSWYYVAVIDRSNCRGLGDTPAVLLFSEVK